MKAGTGLHPRPASAENLRSHFSQIDPSWSSIWYPTRKGETVEDVHDRAGAFLELLNTHVERTYPGKHERILLVSHAATVIALTRELVGNRELRLRIGCCSLTTLRRKQDASAVRGGWDALTLGTGNHLARGALRDWGFDDIVIKDGKVCTAFA